MVVDRKKIRSRNDTSAVETSDLGVRVPPFEDLHRGNRGAGRLKRRQKGLPLA